MVQPGADHSCRDCPRGDGRDVIGRTTTTEPPALRDHDRGDDAGGDGEPVGPDCERAEVDRTIGWARDRSDDVLQCTHDRGYYDTLSYYPDVEIDLEVPAERRGRPRVVIVLGVIGLAALAYYIVAMPGMDHGGDAMGDMDHDASAQELSPTDYATRLDDGGAFVVNVHPQPTRRLAASDVLISYEQIADTPLPSDPATPILLYCETGRLSRKAAGDLVAAGYTDVAYLDGGLRAWVEEGRRVVPVNRTG